MTWQSGGGGGIPGMVPDGRTPAGFTQAGAVNAGDPNAATVATYHFIYGAIDVTDSPGNNIDSDNLLELDQQTDLTQNSGAQALDIHRSGALNGHQYLQAALHVQDDTGSTGPLVQIATPTLNLLLIHSDGVQLGGVLRITSIATHTLGAYSGKAVAVYDASDVLLGYMPLYA